MPSLCQKDPGQPCLETTTGLTRWTHGSKSSISQEVQLFAEADVVATKQDIETAIAVTKDNLRQREESIRQRELAGLERDHLQEVKRVNMENFEKKLLKLRAAAATLPQQLGHILVSGSGMTDHPKPRIVDYAFVSVETNFPDTNLADRNILPTTKEIGSNIPNEYVERTYYTAAEGPFVDVFGSIEKGNWYFKKGRTTGITGGICHGAEVVLNVKSTRAIVQADDTYEHRRVEQARAAIIINAPMQQPNAQQRTFARGGDHGALVFDHNGVCCGLLFGSYSSDTGPHAEDDFGYATAGAGLVVPIEEVRGWIGEAVRSRQPDGRPDGPPGELLIPRS